MVSRSKQFKDGEQIGGTVYRVTSLVGSGGMGSVYEVEHLELGRRFVLKALHGHLSSRSDLVGRMRNEWRALAKLDHPNIVQVTDAGQTASGLPYYVMERLEGHTVGQLLSMRGKLSLAEAGGIVVDVLRGLDAAHETGAIHRDIKPQNIFVLENGTAKLLDFGIAKLRDQVAKVVTAGGVSIGTPRFMAPEQAQGTQVDGRADIYAAALVLYELLLGRGPFAHIKDPNELVMAHIGEEPERADYMDANIAPEVGDLLQRWLSKSPDSRPGRANLAADELSALLLALPGDEEEDADVTRGGDHEAATVGAPRSAASWSPPKRDSVSYNPPPSERVSRDSSPALGAEASRTLYNGRISQPADALGALTPTATLVQPEGKGSTLGFGTGRALDASSTGRVSKTPPPVSERSRAIASTSRRFGSLMIAGTAFGSFAIAATVMFALRAKEEPARTAVSAAVSEEVASAERVEEDEPVEAPTSLRDDGHTGIDEEASEPRIEAEPPSPQQVEAEVPLEPAEISRKAKAPAAREPEPPAPKARPPRLERRADPVKKASDLELPGSGLW